MTVYRLHSENSTVVFLDIESVMDEVRFLLSEGSEVYVSHDEMSLEEYESLLEHQGY